MSNRFRTVIKGTSKELLSAGKQNVDPNELNEEAASEDIVTTQAELIIEREPDTQPISNAIPEEAPMANDPEFIEVSNFLRQKVNNNVFEIRINKLKDIINAIIFYCSSDTQVVVTDNRDNIKSWIKAIGMSLPPQISRWLVFKTFESENVNIQKLAILNADTKNTDITKCLPEQLMSFNFINGACDRVEYASKFSEFMQIGYFLQDQSIHVFKRFTEEFTYEKLDKNIDNSLELFNVINNGVENLDSASIEKASDFAYKYSKLENSINIYNALEKNICKLNINTDEAIVVSALKFAFKMAHLSGVKIEFDKLYNFLFEHIRNILNRKNQNCIDEAIAFYNQVKVVRNETEFNFEGYVISNIDTNTSFKSCMEVNQNCSKFYFMIVVELLKEKGYLWKSTPEFGKFVYGYMHKCISNIEELQSLIDTLNDSNEIVVNLIVSYYNSIHNNQALGYQVVELFINKLDNEWMEQPRNIRSMIIKDYNGSGFIFDEFKIRLKKAEVKDDFFWSYISDVFESFLNFKEEYFSEALEYYHDLIKSEPSYKKEYPRIFNMVDKNQIKVSTEALTHIIEEYEKDLPFRSIDQVAQLILKVVGRIKRSKAIKTTNDISTFFEYGSNLQKALTNGEVKRILGELPDTSVMSTDKYNEFVSWCLDILFNNGVAKTTDIISFYNSVINQEGRDSREAFIDSLISSSNEMDNANYAKLDFYIEIVVEYLADTKHVWNKSGKHEAFIYSCMESVINNAAEMEKLLDKLIKQEHYFVNLLLKYSERLASLENAAVVYFVKKVKQNGEAWARSIRNSVLENGNDGEFLFEEFKVRINEAADKSAFFWIYNKEVFEFMREYKGSFFTSAAKYYMDLIRKGSNYAEECTKIAKLAIGGSVILAKDILEEVITNFEHTLPLSNSTNETRNLIDGVARIKAENNIVTEPDITEMVRFALSLEKAKDQQEIKKILQNAMLSIEELQLEKYIGYLNWCFTAINDKANFIECSDELNGVLCIERFRNNYLDIYNRIIFKQISLGIIGITKLQIKSILLGLDGDIKATVDTLLMYFNQCKKDNKIRDAVELLMVTLSKYDHSGYQQAIACINAAPGGNEMLFEEFKYKLGNSANKPEFFWGYCAKVVNELKIDRGIYYDHIVEVYLESIKDSMDYAAECYRIIRLIAEDQAQIKHEILVKIIEACESLIVVGRPERTQQMMINNITRIKEEKKVVTTPDITSLLNFGMKLENMTDQKEIRQLLEKTTLNFDNLTLVRYEEFLDWCLPKIIPCVNHWKVHSIIKNLLCDEKREGLFYIKYFGILDTEVEVNKLEGIKIFVRFIISFFSMRDKQKEEVLIQVRANAFNAMIRQTEVIIKEMDTTLRSEVNEIANKEGIIREWEQLYNRAIPMAKKDKNILGKLFKGSK